MTVGLLLVDCFLAGSLSLKDKRHILASVTERLRRSFNLAVCEVEHQNQWQRARVALVLVNTDWRALQSTAAKALEMLERHRELSVLDTELRRLC
uniref:DUF503 domain-containing protein n=1 Tax=candidate division WOR-3 bacterium TaxID=2052148 RepID=A0A7C4GHP9_UNCW3